MNRLSFVANNETMHSKVVQLYCTFSLIVSFSFAFTCLAQEKGRDTIRLSVKTSEELFLKNNYDLILKRYDIEKAKAEVITARLFENPEISYENVLYNPSSKKFFQTSAADGQGQFTAQYSQLIRLAGKRNKNIQLAGTGVKLTEYEFADLLRTLRYTLRTDFYDLYYSQQSAKVYGNGILSLQQTADIFNAQYQKGNIAEKEVVRIKSLLYSLRAEFAAFQNEIEDKQTELKMLLRLDPDAVIIPEGVKDPENVTPVSQISYQQLLDAALSNRPDIKAVRAGMDYAGINLSLQKANAVPDITISGSYDLQGSYVKHYTGLGVTLPLPLFNRNQGAVKQAKIDLEAGNTLMQSKLSEVENQVSNSYHSALRLEHVYAGLDSGFGSDLERLISEVNKNYLKRNISLLEFLDFYNSYRENMLQLNEMRAGILSSLEELNYITGTTVFSSD